MGEANTILIVDDEPLVRDLLLRRLRDFGYCALGAASHEEALKLLQEYKQIGVVMLDILMPRRNGMGTAEAIKKDFPLVKIIISSVFPQDEQRFLIGCADGYYDKSDAFSILTNNIDRLLCV